MEIESFIGDPPAVFKDSVDVYSIDVGQGDCTLIIFPGTKGNRVQIMIDCGSTRGGQESLANIKDCLDNTLLDCLVVTHKDGDHFNMVDKILKDGVQIVQCRCGGPLSGYGLDGYAQNFQNGVFPDWYSCANFRDISDNFLPMPADRIFSTTLPLIPLQTCTGAELIYQKPAGCQSTMNYGFEICFAPNAGRIITDPNDYSLVCRLTVRRPGEYPGGGFTHCFLFCGDASSDIEDSMIGSTTILPLGGTLGAAITSVTIAKLSHHGSRNSSSAAFIAAMDPHIATVSASEDNRYDHPHLDVKARLEDHTAFGDCVFNPTKTLWQLWQPPPPNQTAWSNDGIMPLFFTGAGTLEISVVHDTAVDRLFVKGYQQCMDYNGNVTSQGFQLTEDGDVFLT